MTYKTSGKLVYSEVKGLLRCDEHWWIDLGPKFAGLAFRLFDGNEHEIGRLAECRLHMFPGYLYDGSSGPTDDDGNIDPVPAGVHDEVYEALREPPEESSIPKESRNAVRALIDQVYDELCAERGMGKWFEPHGPDSWWKVWQYWRVLNPGHRTRYHFLRAFGGGAASQLRGPQYPRREAA